MTDRFPTFRSWSLALAGAWARFSYSESVAAKGAVWTLAAWLIGGVAATALAFIGLALGKGEAGLRAADASMPSLLVFFPGTPLIGFILGAALSGRSAGFWNALRRGLKASAFLTLSIMLLAALTMTSSNEKAGLVAAILFWIGVSGALAALLGGALRWLVDLGLARSKTAAAPSAPAALPAGRDDGAWLAAVAEELKTAGLFDCATALAVYKALQNSGRAAPDAPPPLEAKYEEIFARLQELFPDKKREQWLEANARLRQAMLITAKAGGGAKAARAALRDDYPNLSDAFYEWLAERARQLP